MSNNLLMTAIFPHPPIIIPEVGKLETKKVEKTIIAIQNLSAKIAKANPETVIIITPHSNFNPYFFNVYSDNILEGNFANFGAPAAKIRFKNDLEFIAKLELNIKEDFNDLKKIPAGTPLDHGSAVPLYYLSKADYNGKITVINYTSFGAEEHLLFGKKIRQVISELSRSTVFIASGDLSHKLSSNAPAGYHPDAHFFDETVVDGIAKGNYSSITNISPILRKKAGECGFNSLMTAFGAINRQPQQNEVFSYEAPFGVGYLVAAL